jgi:hypothetical protein
MPTTRISTTTLRDAQGRELDRSDQMVWNREQPYCYERSATEHRLLRDLPGVPSQDEAWFAFDRLRRRP